MNLIEGHVSFKPARYLDDKYYDGPRGWFSNEKCVWELFSDEYDEQYWNRRNKLYRATVDYLDRCIADFVRSVDSNTTVIITANHGDNVGTETDERLANHKSSLSEGVLHVSLGIINSPTAATQSGRYFSQL